MSGKYMTTKRIIIPTMTLIILASQLFGCSSASQQEAHNMLQQTEQIEIEYAVPEYDVEAEVSLLPWLQLASLTTHPEIRTAFEQMAGITVEEDGTKTGSLYTDENGNNNQNITLFKSMANSDTFEYCLNSEDGYYTLQNLIINEYTDIESDDFNQIISAVVNSYFELLPDQESAHFDGDSSISRAQAMTLLMRAITPVNEAQAPEKDQSFTSQVGENEYTNFAAPMNQYCFINIKNGLNEKAFNSTMTRGEYIHMLTNVIFNDDYNKQMESIGNKVSQDISLVKNKDGGNISLKSAINNPENGLPTALFNNLTKAVNTGFISEDDLRWDESITKSDAIQLLLDAVNTYYYNLTNPVEDSNTNNIEEQPEVSEEERQAYYEAEQESLPDYLKDNQETTENSKPQKEVIKIYDPVKYPSFGDNDRLPVTSESFAKEIRKNRETFEKYYNEESYGTYTKGKIEGELPYVGNTNYDGSVIIDAYTDKGFLIKYDTSTGRVYYSGMTLPTGGGFMDGPSDTVLGQYCMDHMYNSCYDLTYAEMQQLLGTYNGN